MLDFIVSERLNNGAPLFDSFRLSVPTGQFLFVLGMNGVGKTTLLRSVQRQHAGHSAYMSQRPALLPWMRVRDNVCLGPHLRAGRVCATDRQRADMLLAAVGLSEWADARPALLSGGMQQRAALARTLFEDQSLILMDEPFSALDAISRQDMRALCQRLLKDSGKTVMCVTHDPLDAWMLGDRVIVLTGRPVRIALDITLPGPTLRPLEGADLAIAQMMAALS